MKVYGRQRVPAPETGLHAATLSDQASEKIDRDQSCQRSLDGGAVLNRRALCAGRQRDGRHSEVSGGHVGHPDVSGVVDANERPVVVLVRVVCTVKSRAPLSHSAWSRQSARNVQVARSHSKPRYSSLRT